MPETTPPIARSPLDDRHQRSGAAVELRDGWRIAVRYPVEPRPGQNALIDFSHRSTLELTGPGVAQSLTALCGSELAVRKIHRGEGWQACRLTANRALVFGTVPIVPADALDVTGGWATLLLTGPDAERILNKVTAVDVRERTLPVDGCCQGPIFGVNVLFGRIANRFELSVGGDSAEFIWDVLLDAGGEFGLEAAGVDFVRLRASEV